jgi:hypothetical protein
MRVSELQRKDSVQYAKDAKAESLGFLQGVAVRDLVAKSFHVFDDGKEQEITSVTFEPQSALTIQDNLGEHVEAIGDAGGIWSTPKSEVPEFNRTVTFSAGREALASGDRAIVKVPAWPGYLVAYSAPPSPEGSCHQLVVKVDRPSSLVYARTEYCKAKTALAGPAAGRIRGRNTASGMSPQTAERVPLTVSAVSLFSAERDSRVEISVAWPAIPLELQGKDCQEPQRIGLSATLYKTEGKALQQVSDVLATELSQQPFAKLVPGHVASCVLPTPDRYETQIYATPGDFNLRISVQERHASGSAEIPVHVEGHDGTHLAISGVAIAKEFRNGQVRPVDASAKSEGKYVPLVSNDVRYTPTFDPRFKKGEQLYFYFEVFQPQTAEALLCAQSNSRLGAYLGCTAAVQAHLRIIDARTGTLVGSPKLMDATPFKLRADPIIPIGGGIKVGGLPAGNYCLEVQASDSTGQATPWHTANFIIQ